MEKKIFNSTEEPFIMKELNEIIMNVQKVFEQWLDEKRSQISVDQKEKIKSAISLWDSLFNSWSPREKTTEGLKKSAIAIFERYLSVSEVSEEYQNQLLKLLEQELEKIGK